MAKRRAARGRISFKPLKDVKTALVEMRKAGRQVKVVGRVKAGKLEIDQVALADVAKKSKQHKMTFVALNAPFKTRALTGSL